MINSKVTNFDPGSGGRSALYKALKNNNWNLSFRILFPRSELVDFLFHVLTHYILLLQNMQLPVTFGFCMFLVGSTSMPTLIMPPE